MFDFDAGIPWPFVGFLVLAGVFVCMMAAALTLVVRVLARNAGGGMRGLLDRYPAGDACLEGYRFAPRRTVQVGSVILKRSATIGTGPQGLFLKHPWRPPVLIPWNEIRSVDRASLYWREAVSLVVGSPPVARLTLFPEDFATVRPSLSHRAPCGEQATPTAVI
jgi:hypothetical protein